MISSGFKQSVTLCMLLAAAMFAPAVRAQDRQPTKPESVETLVYQAASTPVADLAAAIENILEVGAVKSLPVRNALVITGPRAKLDRVASILMKLDKPMAMLHYHLHLLELSGDTNKDDLPEFSGSAAQIAARIRDLKKQGKIASLTEIKVSSLENNPATFQIGERVGVVTSTSSSRPGYTQRSVRFEQTGQLLRVTARVAGEEIVAEVDFEKSSLKPQKGEKELARGSDTFTVKSTVRLKPGQTVNLGSVAPGSVGQRILLLSAQVGK